MSPQRRPSVASKYQIRPGEPAASTRSDSQSRADEVLSAGCRWRADVAPLPQKPLQLSAGKYNPCSRAWPPSLSAVGFWPAATRPSHARLARVTPAGSQGPRAGARQAFLLVWFMGHRAFLPPESLTPSVAERHPQGAPRGRGVSHAAFMPRAPPPSVPSLSLLPSGTRGLWSGLSRSPRHSCPSGTFTGDLI